MNKTELTGLNLARQIDEDFENNNFHALVGIGERIYKLIKENYDNDVADKLIKIFYENGLFNV